MAFVGTMLISSTVYSETVKFDISIDDYHMKIPVVKNVYQSTNPTLTLCGIWLAFFGIITAIFGVVWWLTK